MDSSIGGYFELELPVREEYHNNALRLNTGRNAFEYVLRAKRYKKVYLPYYTCDAMFEPINKLGLDYEFYSIDSNFVPIFNYSNVQENEVFVYNNYLGICDLQTREVAAQCKNLIIDNSQAFYSKPINGVDTFYSPRKFFGLPDGAYLYTDKLLDYILERDISYKRCEHLLGRIDTNAEQYFQVYKENSKNLCNQPIKEMSNLTQRLLVSIDYKTISEKRMQNFNLIHNELSKKNKLKLDVSSTEVPMVYPFLVENGKLLKQKLISNKIYVASYWPNVLEWSETTSHEYNIVSNLIALPIDQRYGTSEMSLIISFFNDIIDK
jgi:hypothetical protein